MRLTFGGKLFAAAVIAGVAVLTFYKNPGWMEKIAPSAQKVPSNIPPVVTLPDLPATELGPESQRAGCADVPEVRFYHWAWNAQAGMMLAAGGKQAIEGSAMCKHGVNLRLIREDSTDNMGNLMMAFAESLKKGEQHPAAGAHFIAIMGDGSATFLKGMNDRLQKLGPDYVANVIGSTGYSRGEDKMMGPAAWKQNPQAARGGLVSGVLRDGDWNIAMKWLGDNKIPNNPDEQSYDPDALNWVNATDYIEAAQKYVSGFCAELKNIKTGQKEKHCVDGVVTWTPGDVTIAEQKGGLVNIVSTREYRSQMPSVIIGNKKWMAANREVVEGMLAAIFEGGDQIKQSEDALDKASAISAQVYAEKDGAYWAKYFHVRRQKDKQGLDVELGGSAVSNLADNLQLFGLAKGSTNVFAATYSVFGDIVKSQYPSVVPSYYPVNQILDVSYLKGVQAGVGEAEMNAPDLALFNVSEPLKEVVSRRSWDIQFNSGSADFTKQTSKELEALFKDLIVAGGTIVEIHGHTDNQGTAESNQALSEKRAFAVKEWMETKSPTNFPEGRVRVFAHGMSQPVAPNTTDAGRAKNRRVEIVLGTAGSSMTN